MAHCACPCAPLFGGCPSGPRLLCSAASWRRQHPFLQPSPCHLNAPDSSISSPGKAAPAPARLCPGHFSVAEVSTRFSPGHWPTSPQDSELPEGGQAPPAPLWSLARGRCFLSVCSTVTTLTRKGGGTRQSTLSKEGHEGHVERHRCFPCKQQFGFKSTWFASMGRASRFQDSAPGPRPGGCPTGRSEARELEARPGPASCGRHPWEPSRRIIPIMAPPCPPGKTETGRVESLSPGQLLAPSSNVQAPGCSFALQHRGSVGCCPARCSMERSARQGRPGRGCSSTCSLSLSCSRELRGRFKEGRAPAPAPRHTPGWQWLWPSCGCLL